MSAPTTAGVPRHLATSTDFLMVRAALVRHLGGANAALVFTRVQFRCDVSGQDRVEDPTGRWWRATLEVLAEETGLTPKAVRTAVTALIDAGHLEARVHQAGGVYDRARSLRPRWENPETTEVPVRADRGAAEGASHLPMRADVPLSQDAKNPARSEVVAGQLDARSAALAACTLCDEDGYWGTVLCDHDPGTPARAARGRALIAEALARKS